MTLLAFKTHYLYMRAVLSHRQNLAVAIHAVAPVRPRSLMRMVALVAGELHGPIGRSGDFSCLFNDFIRRLIMGNIKRLIGYELFSDFFASVAEQTFPRSGPEVRRSVCVTVQTGDFFHAGAVNYFSLMTFQAEPRLGSKLMGNIPMTF